MQQIGGGSPLTTMGLTVGASQKDGAGTAPVYALRVAGADLGYIQAQDVAFVRLERSHWPWETQDGTGSERASLPRQCRGSASKFGTDKGRPMLLSALSRVEQIKSRSRADTVKRARLDSCAAGVRWPPLYPHRPRAPPPLTLPLSLKQVASHRHDEDAPEPDANSSPLSPLSAALL